MLFFWKENKMFEVECNNCREVNQLNDRMKNKTVRCHICKKVIQIGEVKKEVVKNINMLDDHELRIQVIEKTEYPQHYYQHPANYYLPFCICSVFSIMDFFLSIVFFILALIITGACIGFFILPLIIAGACISFFI